MLHGLSECQTGDGIPQSRETIPATGDDHVSVGTDGNSGDSIRVCHGNANELLGVGIPEPNATVFTCCDNGLAIGTEDGVPYDVLVKQGLPDRLRCGRVPDSGGVVDAAG